VTPDRRRHVRRPGSATGKHPSATAPDIDAAGATSLQKWMDKILLLNPEKVIRVDIFSIPVTTKTTPT
jgi:hypothetical protein